MDISLNLKRGCNPIHYNLYILKKISNALGIRLVDFFLEEQDEETIVIRKNERFEIKYPQNDASIFMLTKRLTGRSMEPLYSTVRAWVRKPWTIFPWSWRRRVWLCDVWPTSFNS